MVNVVNHFVRFPLVRVSARNAWRWTRLSTYPKGAAPGHLVISSAAASVLETRFPAVSLSSRPKSSTAATMVDPVALGLTEEDVELIVKRYLQEKRDKYNAKFRVLSYHVKRLSEEPIGYLGDHYFLNVVLREKMVHYSAEEEEYAEEEYLSFFLKILPEQVPKLADYVREMGCFKKEIQLYTHLIPRLQDVTIGTKPFAPRAYLTKDEKLLVFENLKAEGYRMLENNKSLLDFAHLEVALKTVAKLHAASLVLEERTKQPIMKLYSGHLNENVYIDDVNYVRKTNLDNAIKALCELIKRIDKYKNSDKLDFILEKFPEVIRKIYDFARPSTEYRNVFNHGDLWNNNLMFKYEEPEKATPNCDPVPVSAVLVDYQFSRLAPPAYDVMSLIMISTLSSFRNKHLEAWKNIYYDELGSLLAEFDSIDVEDLLPRAVFLESCREYHLAGLIESCMYFHWPPTPDCYEIVNGADWFDESRKPAVFVQASLNGFERNEDYRHRISDMIMQIVDGYTIFSRIASLRYCRIDNIAQATPTSVSMFQLAVFCDHMTRGGVRVFWIVCVIVSWFGSALLINASLEAFRTSAISFVVETNYRDWNTKFPAIVICEMRNMERIQMVADELWGEDHDFAMEEVLNEISYFRGESYHTMNECDREDAAENCFYSNFSDYARLVRSTCEGTLEECYWNEKPFDCCKYFQPMETELGVCYAVNSAQTSAKNPLKIDMISNKYTGPGKLKVTVLTEAYVYTLGEEDVPNLITPKSEVLLIDYYIAYKRQISIKDIENDPETKQVSVEQRKCRYPDENILDVHEYYSYSACSVQCRKDKQLQICNCTSHLMPNTDPSIKCNMTGLVCLNAHYEELTIVIPKWSTGKQGVVCDCLPSCTEVDIAIVHDSRESLYNPEKRYSTIEIELAALPTERYKRNVVRGRLDLVVSVGGTTGLFVGASLLSFVEIVYYFTIRPYGTVFMRKYRGRQQIR